MIDRDNMVKDPSKLLKGWDFSFIDGLGRSGGNIIGWEKRTLSLCQILGLSH
jgi:hypothetical protein